MESLEALELAILEYKKDLEEDSNNQWVKNVLQGLKEVKQDLERLEILEKENQELKETLNKLRKMGLEIIEENKQLSNELHKLNCYRNIELNENVKLKQALDILKRYVAISKRRNEVNGNYDISCIYSFGSYKDITQKEYELLNEVLGNE